MTGNNNPHPFTNRSLDTALGGDDGLDARAEALAGSDDVARLARPHDASLERLLVGIRVAWTSFCRTPHSALSCGLRLGDWMARSPAASIDLSADLLCQLGVDHGTVDGRSVQ